MRVQGLLDRFRNRAMAALIIGTAVFAVRNVSAMEYGCCASNTSHCDVLDANNITCTALDQSDCAEMYHYCCTVVGTFCKDLNGG